MRRLVVEIADDAFARLVRWAVRERRPTRDQAAVLLERAVSADGAETERQDPPAPVEVPR